MIPPAVALALVIAVSSLTGCATGPTSGLSSLGREVNATPRGQGPEQITQDDADCERWTRATKGNNEPLPSAELRYAACVIARGYEAQVGDEPRGARVSLPTPRGLDVVIQEMQACRVDKAAVGAFDHPGDLFRGRQAMTCLTTHGYVVTEIERVYPQDQDRRTP